MEHGQGNQDSVFDFVYIDTKRIALYLTQLSEFGHLTSLVRSVQEGDQSKLSVGPRVLRSEVDESQQTSLQKHYDTQWVAPLSLLEELQHRDMIKHIFEDVQLGDIFILPGELSLIDVGMFARVWDVVAAHQEPASTPRGNRHQRRAAARLEPPPAAVQGQQSQLGLRTMGALDQPLFVNFHSKGRHFWSLGESACVVGQGAAMVLKHGLASPGRWHLLAILDALPDKPAWGADWLARICGGNANSFGTHLIDVLSEFGKILERPEGAYGVTPLAIFREVGARVT